MLCAPHTVWEFFAAIAGVSGRSNGYNHKQKPGDHSAPGSPVSSAHLMHHTLQDNVPSGLDRLVRRPTEVAVLFVRLIGRMLAEDGLDERLGDEASGLRLRSREGRRAVIIAAAAMHNFFR
jgi:hypothetical protein